MRVNGRTLCYYGGDRYEAKHYEAYLYRQQEDGVLRFSSDKEDVRYRDWSSEDEIDDVQNMRLTVSIIWQPDLDEYDTTYLEEDYE